MHDRLPSAALRKRIEMTKNKKAGFLILGLAILLIAGWLIISRGQEKDFGSWRPDAASLSALRDYVTDVTRPGSENFIPVEDRIAVFDMDGTLYCEKAPIYIEWLMYCHRVLEDPSYEASEELIAVADEIREAAKSGVIPEDLERNQAIAGAKAYAGMTIGEYREYATSYLLNDAAGFSGMSYGEAWYLPMLEVVDYLNDHDFTVYICSGTDRFLCRTLAEGMVDIPERQIIGMDVLCVASGQGETDGLDYVYTAGDDVVRTEHLLIKNVKANKVSQIVQEIGTKPVLSFGNSTGDQSMAMYTTSANPYRSMAFMVVADDTEREYGNPAKAAELCSKWEKNGWVPISMKNDWLTIYGDGVTKE